MQFLCIVVLKYSKAALSNLASSHGNLLMLTVADGTSKFRKLDHFFPNHSTSINKAQLKSSKLCNEHILFQQFQGEFFRFFSYLKKKSVQNLKWNKDRIFAIIVVFWLRILVIICLGTAKNFSWLSNSGIHNFNLAQWCHRKVHFWTMALKTWI